MVEVCVRIEQVKSILLRAGWRLSRFYYELVQAESNALFRSRKSKIFFRDISWNFAPRCSVCPCRPVRFSFESACSVYITQLRQQYREIWRELQKAEGQIAKANAHTFCSLLPGTVYVFKATERQPAGEQIVPPTTDRPISAVESLYRPTVIKVIRCSWQPLAIQQTRIDLLLSDQNFVIYGPTTPASFSETKCGPQAEQQSTLTSCIVQVRSVVKRRPKKDVSLSSLLGGDNANLSMPSSASFFLFALLSRQSRCSGVKLVSTSVCGASVGCGVC